MKPLDKKQFARVVSDTEKDWRYRFMIDQTIEDLETRKPDVVFVPVALLPCKTERCQYMDVLALLNQSKRFSTVWQKNYQPKNILRFCKAIEETDTKCSYKVFVRNRIK